jgi:hypothetical protein
MLMYLPDNPATHVTRDYLFTVVNTLDQQFFPTIVSEIKSLKV